jgi:integrase
VTARRTRQNGEGSIFPYRNGFAAYVWVNKADAKRGRKWVYGSTREEVHEKWVKLHARALAGPVPTKTPAVADHLAYWLREIVEPRLAPLTHSTYDTLTRLYIAPGLGSKRLDRLQVRDVQTWINQVVPAVSMLCSGQGCSPARTQAAVLRCRCCRATPSANTISDLRKVLRSALSHAMTEELINRNVATLVKLPPVRRRRGQAWSTEEARRFLESARRDDDPFYAAYVLVLVLGLRKGELLGLTWDAVDLDKAELTTALQLQRVRRQLPHRETKTASSEATLPIPELCVTALKVRQEQTEVAREAAGETWRGSTLVFTTRWGTPVDPRNFNRSWDYRIEASGVRKITVHDARRTCGTLLADLDVHPRVAMAILRHARFSITMEIYTQASTKATREALKRLGESLDG